jgi:hypothetical protein
MLTKMRNALYILIWSRVTINHDFFFENQPFIIKASIWFDKGRF